MQIEEGIRVMLRSKFGALALVVAAVSILVTLPISVIAAPAGLSATASLSPTTVGQGAPTTFTLTVDNTGTSSIGAVEVRRPNNKWLINSCLTAPAGWAVQTEADTMCRFRSAAGTGDDIPPTGSSNAFTFTATALPGTVTGTFKVTVSNLNTFSKPARLVVASGSLTVTANGDAAPSVTSTSPTNGATNVATNATIVINFSEDVSAPI